MEQLKERLNFTANIIDGGGDMHPFSFTIFEPVVEDEYAAYCILLCPYLRPKEFKIFGVDEEHAVEMSLHFIVKALAGQRIIDEDGEPLSLPFPSAKKDLGAT